MFSFRPRSLIGQLGAVASSFYSVRDTQKTQIILEFVGLEEFKLFQLTQAFLYFELQHTSYDWGRFEIATASLVWNNGNREKIFVADSSLEVVARALLAIFVKYYGNDAELERYLDNFDNSRFMGSTTRLDPTDSIYDPSKFYLQLIFTIRVPYGFKPRNMHNEVNKQIIEDQKANTALAFVDPDYVGLRKRAPTLDEALDAYAYNMENPTLDTTPSTSLQAASRRPTPISANPTYLNAYTNALDSFSPFFINYLLALQSENE